MIWSLCRDFEMSTRSGTMAASSTNALGLIEMLSPRGTALTGVFETNCTFACRFVTSLSPSRHALSPSRDQEPCGTLWCFFPSDGLRSQAQIAHRIDSCYFGPGPSPTSLPPMTSPVSTAESVALCYASRFVSGEDPKPRPLDLGQGQAGELLTDVEDAMRKSSGGPSHRSDLANN